MAFHPFEVTIPHIAYACIGGFVVLFGMFSLFLRERLYIGEACWAFIFGVIIGPYGANIFDPRNWGGGTIEVTNGITLEFTRVVLAIGVFAIGVELPKSYMARHWKSLVFLLFPVMTWGWFISAALIYALIPGLHFLASLAVAACLTPTDPILAAAIVGGKWADKHVPAHLRHLLAAESGCNDGAAFPFLFIAMYLLLESPDTGGAIRDWFLILWLYQVILGIVIGALLGYGFRHLMKFCQRHDLIDRQSYVAQYLSLATLTIGVTTLLGSDDLLAAFSCGTAFAWDGFFNRQTEEAVFSSVIDLLFNIAAFVFVGAWMPFSSFNDHSLTLSVWRLIVIAILVLLLRRLPAMIALYRWIPDVKTFREAIFSGHFGPMGIGAIFISTFATEIIHNDKHHHGEQVELLSKSIQPIVSFMVLCSIAVHGLSIPGFSLGRRVHSVSRTWSRHAPPDWTTQARFVERGAPEITINRDERMERGEAGGEKAEPLRSKTPSETLGTPGKDEGSVETKKGESPVEHAKPDAPPDGTAVVTEWQEPHRKLVERRTGPGEDVDVEVLVQDDPELTRPRRHSLLANEVRQGLEALRRTVQSLETKGGQQIAQEVRDIRSQVHDIHERITEAFPAHHEGGDEHGKGKASEHGNREGDGGEGAPPSVTPVITTTPPHEGDDEGWASDQSQTGPSTGAGAGVGEPRKKPKAVKMKTTSSKASATAAERRARQRTSIRRAHGPPQSLVFPPGEDQPPQAETGGEEEIVEEERGRSPIPSLHHQARHSHPRHHLTHSYPTSPQRVRPSTADRIYQRSRPGTAESTLSLRHDRLDRLRALHSSPPTREVSPSRSIRFMDEVFGDRPRETNRPVSGGGASRSSTG